MASLGAARGLDLEHLRPLVRQQAPRHLGTSRGEIHDSDSGQRRGMVAHLLGGRASRRRLSRETERPPGRALHHGED